MDRDSTTPDATELFAGEAWLTTPIEAGLRDRFSQLHRGDGRAGAGGGAGARALCAERRRQRATGMGHASGG